MPILMQVRGNRSCPVVVCDHCADAVESADSGNAVWNMADPSAQIFFTHKRCNREFERQHGGVTWGWQPLPAFAVFVVVNLGMDWERAKGIAEMIESI